MRIFRKVEPEHIAVEETGFTVLRSADLLWQVEFDPNVRVECCKRDLITTDLICFDVSIDAGAGLAKGVVHEEAPGWAELAACLAHLHGFDAGWYAKVVQPPFAENRMVVYERPGS